MRRTVKEQLLYEIQNPAEYLTPDVIADFTGLTVQQQGEKVLVRGATGRPKTGLLKTSVGYRDGYIGEGEISYGGHNCTRRAQLAETVLRHRFAMLGLALREVRFDLLGVSSLYGPAAGVFAPAQLAEVRLRVAARTAHEENRRRDWPRGRGAVCQWPRRWRRRAQPGDQCGVGGIGAAAAARGEGHAPRAERRTV